MAAVRGRRSTDLDLAGVHLVRTLELDTSRRARYDARLCERHRPRRRTGDRRRQVLRLAPPPATVPGADSDDGQRPVRAPGRAASDGVVRYLGFAIPEVVYVDFDVIASAPAGLNRAGVGDILCYHTAHLDWRLSRDLGREEARWPYDEGLVDAARHRLDAVMGALDESTT